MRFAPPWTPLVLGVLIGMTVAVPIAAQSPKQIKKAQKLLDKILLVDGAGSGLDADTVHGMTPGEVAASVTPPTPEETLSALQGVDGTGSGLDADTVRGMTPDEIAASVTPPTPEETLSALQGVDGTGSGLDADTVRGMTPVQIAGMAGGAAGGLRVVDSQGRVVGPPGEDVGSDVLMRVNGIVIQVGANAGGFADDAVFLLHQSSDCSDAPLLSAVPPEALVVFAQQRGGTLYYPGRPLGDRVISSASLFTTPEECADAQGAALLDGRCCRTDIEFGAMPVAPVAQFDLTSLGLVPPFRIEGL